jgi:uncharacterized ubiquitin-like protein YukD
MSQEDLLKAIKQSPFVPVRLKLSNGATYDIRHPDAILIEKRVAAVADAGSISLVSLMHINEVTPIPVTSA